jgi:hypothetical protein
MRGLLEVEGFDHVLEDLDGQWPKRGEGLDKVARQRLDEVVARPQDVEDTAEECDWLGGADAGVRR